MKYVETYKDLKNSTLLKQSLKEGDIIYVEDEAKGYIYLNGRFVPKEIKSEGNLNLSLYEMNKQLISQLKDISKEDALEKIYQFYEHTPQGYYMLLNHENKYFTLFEKNTNGFDTFGSTVLYCINNIGKIKTIDVYDDRLEIWITIKDNIFDYLLFPYDEGVVKYFG